MVPIGIRGQRPPDGRGLDKEEIMPNPLCVRCQVEFRPKKNGVFVEEMAPFGSYKIWHADLWQCPCCKTEIVQGYAQQPIAEHYQKEYQEKLNLVKEHELYKCFEYPIRKENHAEDSRNG